MHCDAGDILEEINAKLAALDEALALPIWNIAIVCRALFVLNLSITGKTSGGYKLKASNLECYQLIVMSVIPIWQSIDPRKFECLEWEIFYLLTWQTGSRSHA